MQKNNLIILHLVGLIFYTMLPIAFSENKQAVQNATCPTNITRNEAGFWVSLDPPGWKSLQPHLPSIIIDSKNFGGAIYSPKKRQIACVYRTNQKRWAGLVSNNKVAISADDLNDNWQFHKKQGDYSCGKPIHTLKECVFKISK